MYRGWVLGRWCRPQPITFFHGQFGQGVCFGRWCRPQPITFFHGQFGQGVCFWEAVPTTSYHLLPWPIWQIKHRPRGTDMNFCEVRDLTHLTLWLMTINTTMEFAFSLLFNLCGFSCPVDVSCVHSMKYVLFSKNKLELNVNLVNNKLFRIGQILNWCFFIGKV
jgi:hypothetical protein